MEASSASERIFVSIPSYRDPECQWTVKNLFEKAKFPDRVFVGICWQYDPDVDKNCFEFTTRPDQVRTAHMHWKDARGPCLARYMAQQLWQGEEFYLQIDSHMRFVADWDVKLLAYLAQCPSPKSILTTYPVGYELPDLVPDETKPTILVADGFGKDGMLRLKSKLLSRVHEKPIASLFWASGFAFSRSAVIAEVPYDPDLPFMFFGEEMLMGARLWTHGWDFFAPGECLVFHLWKRSYRPTFREIETPERQQLEARSRQRVCDILGLPGAKPLQQPTIAASTAVAAAAGPSSHQTTVVAAASSVRNASTTGATAALSEDDDDSPPTPHYGLGSDRSLASYASFCGVDFAEAKVGGKAANGGLSATLFFDDLLSSVFKLPGLAGLSV